MCHPLFTFGSSEDFSPQYCDNGIWDYQRDKIEFPDCQREHKHLFNVVLGYAFSCVRSIRIPVLYHVHNCIYIYIVIIISLCPTIVYIYIYIYVGFHAKTGL